MMSPVVSSGTPTVPQDIKLHLLIIYEKTSQYLRIHAFYTIMIRKTLTHCQGHLPILGAYLIAMDQSFCVLSLGNYFPKDFNSIIPISLIFLSKTTRSNLHSKATIYFSCARLLLIAIDSSTPVDQKINYISNSNT